MTIETPERKVLKEMIVKLKAKTIESQKNYVGWATSMTTDFASLLKQIWEMISKMSDGEEKSRALQLFSAFQLINQNLVMLTTTTISVIGDANLYIETLERYSTELDSTLTSIFEKAKQIAEEQRKQQEELMKKEPTYRA